MTENEIAKVIVDACYKIHSTLGPGLFQTVYEVVLAHELQSRGLQVARQAPVPIMWQGILLDEGFRADVIINELVIIERKSVERLAPVHAKQFLTYLKLTGLRLGLLVNFGEELIKDGIKRIVNGLPDH